MILILDGDRKRGETMRKHLWDLHLLSDVTTYASLRNRLFSDKISDRITFLLLLRPDDSARPPRFVKSVRQKIDYPIVMLGGNETTRGSGDPNVPDLILAADLTDRAILREIRTLFLSVENPIRGTESRAASATVPNTPITRSTVRRSNSRAPNGFFSAR